MTITLKNPDTGDRITVTPELMQELRRLVEQAEQAGRDEIVFCAMRLDLTTARILIEE